MEHLKTRLSWLNNDLEEVPLFLQEEGLLQSLRVAPRGLHALWNWQLTTLKNIHSCIGIYDEQKKKFTSKGKAREVFDERLVEKLNMRFDDPFWTGGIHNKAIIW